MPINKENRKKNWLYSVFFVFLVYLIFQNITMNYAINIYAKQLILFAEKISEIESEKER